MNRREFIASCMAGAAYAAAGGGAFAATKGTKVAKDYIWADLLHLGVNMWIDHPLPDPKNPKFTLQHKGPPQTLQCDENQWRELTGRMHDRHLNMVVVDIAEGLQLPSHPELAVKGAWSPDKMRTEIKRLKALGLEAIPKINFSTSHDTWFGQYGRMVSTKPYYDFCSQIIADVAEIFGNPRFFHFGFDEEAPICQKNYDFMVVRHGDLWWHDLNFLVREIEKHGMRSWMWSDYAWNHSDEFYKRCSRGIVQSNWYYSASFEMEALRKAKEREIIQQEVLQCHELDQVECYIKLEEAGFDQIPCGGNWREEVNLAETVKFCRNHISDDHLLGFLVAPWRRLMPPFREINLHGVDLMGNEIDKLS